MVWTTGKQSIKTDKMRKPNFRFWNKNNNQMYQVDSIDYIGDEITVNDGFLICDEQAILMEYTGRMDVNGQNICEGDYNSDGYHCIYSIALASFIWINDNGDWCLFEMGTSYEINGDIYSNSNLPKNETN